MTTDARTPSFPHRLIMLALLAGLLVMLGTAVWQRIRQPELVQQVAHTPAQHSQEEVSAVGRLMEQVSRDPTDMGSLLSLVNALVKMENWEAAENFARRAIALDARDPRPLHLLGVIQHNTGRHADAAQTLEAVIALRTTPRCATASACSTSITSTTRSAVLPSCGSASAFPTSATA